MAQVQTTFTGDSQRLLAEYQKLLNASTRQEQKLKQLGKQSKKQHDAVTGQIRGQIGSLASLGLSYLSIERGIGFVTGAYRDWRQEIAAVGAEAEKANRELTKQIVLAGDAGHAAEIEAVLNRVPGATRGQAATAFAGVADAGGEISTDRRRALAAAVAQAAPTQVDLKALGTFAGELSKLDVNLAPDRARNLALSIQAELGNAFQRFASAEQFATVRRFVESGAMELPEAIGFFGQSSRNFPELGRQVLEAAERPVKPPGRAIAGQTREEREAQRRLSEAGTFADRAKLIFSDEAAGRFALGAKGDKFLDFLNSAKMEAGTAALENVATSAIGGENVLGRILGSQGLAGSLQTRATLAKDFIKADIEQSQSALVTEDIRADLAELALQRSFEAHGTGFTMRGLTRGGVGFDTFMGHLFGVNDPQGHALTDIGQQDPTRLAGVLYRGALQFVQQGGDAQDLPSKLDQLIAAVERGNEAAERRASDGRTPGATVPDIREK